PPGPRPLPSPGPAPPRPPPSSLLPSSPASPPAFRGACAHGSASPSWFFSCCRPPLEGGHVCCSRTLGPLLGVEADLRALGERLEAAALDGGVMDEEILAGIIGRDETEALVVVEPLHCSCCHVFPLRGVCTR